MVDLPATRLNKSMYATEPLSLDKEGYIPMTSEVVSRTIRIRTEGASRLGNFAMTGTEFNDWKIEVIVDAYAAAARRACAASKVADYEEVNKQHDMIGVLYHELRHRGRSAQTALVPLLATHDECIRLWAAAHCLEFSPTLGEPVLRALASGAPSVVRLDAEMALREWQMSRLRFP